MNNTQQFFCMRSCIYAFMGVLALGCGADEESSANEPLRGVIGNMASQEAEDETRTTDDGVLIVESDQEMADREQREANGGLTCTQIFECFNTCMQGDQACIAQCQDQGAEEARDQVNAVGACMQANQCADNACVEANCAAALTACGFGLSTQDDNQTDTTNPSADSTTLDCNGIYECFGTCNQGDRDCLDGCYYSGSQTAQAQVNAISECAQANQCQDGACVQENCPDQVAACTGSNTPGGSDSQQAHGNLSCAGIFDCYAGCARGDQACLGHCESQGTATAQAQLNAIGACIERHQCQDSSCVDQNCGREVAACDDAAGGTDGALGGGSSNPQPPSSNASNDQVSCPDVFQCFSTCAQGDRSCLDQCYASATPEAQEAVSAIGACIQANACEDDACVNQRCAAEVALCEAGSMGTDGPTSGDRPAPPVPALSCTEIYECFRACDSADQPCRQGCYDRGSITSQGQVNAIGSCIRDNECEDDACVETACIDALTECGFEVTPPPVDEPTEPVTPPVEDPSLDEESTQDPDTDSSPTDEDTDPETSSGWLLDSDEPQPTNGHDANGMCGSPYALSWGSQTGTTVGGHAEHRGQCSGDATEVVYAFQVDEDTELCLDTFDSNFDTALYVRAEDCRSQSAEIICNDDTYGIQSQVRFTAEAGVTYYVFVDGYNVSGEFKLTATRGECPDRFGF